MPPNNCKLPANPSLSRIEGDVKAANPGTRSLSNDCNHWTRIKASILVRSFGMDAPVIPPHQPSRQLQPQHQHQHQHQHRQLVSGWTPC